MRVQRACAHALEVECRWVELPVGTGVVGGMIKAVVPAVFFVPIFFVVVRQCFKPSARQRMRDAPETPNVNLNKPVEDR